MAIIKTYLTIAQAAEELNISVDDLMHYGATGQLQICFDFRFVDESITLNNLPLKLELIFYGHDRKFWASTVDKMKYCNHNDDFKPIDRLFPLSPNQVAIIQRNGKLKLKKAYDEENELTLEIIKNDDVPMAEYPVLEVADLLISSCVMTYFKTKTEQITNSTALDEAISVKDAFQEDNVPTLLYIAYIVNKEIWPIPDNMNLPTKALLEAFIKVKGIENNSDISAIIRLSTPDNITLGGKQKADKIDYCSVLNRK